MVNESTAAEPKSQRAKHQVEVVAFFILVFYDNGINYTKFLLNVNRK